MMKSQAIRLALLAALTCVSAYAQTNTFPSSGNVGIGTTSPGSTLAVNASSGSGISVYDAPDNSAAQIFSIGSAAGKSMWFVPSSCIGCWNGLVQMNDQALIFSNGSSGTGNLVIAPWNSPGGVRITSSGAVGIGTSTPGAVLEVNGNVKLTTGAGASMTYSDGTVQSTAWTGTLTGGDYAESVDVTGSREQYEPGDVLVIDPDHSGRFLKAAERYSLSVTGVYSTRPGVVGRRQKIDKALATTEVPMAMVGIVPIKVTAENGPILRGDVLVTSSRPGYAMKGTDRSLLAGAVIGKALEPLNSDTGVIEAVISLQ